MSKPTRLTVGMKRTFHQAVREACAARGRWHLPAHIWLLPDGNDSWFEAHPDTVKPDWSNAEVILSLTGTELSRLDSDDWDSDQWEIEVNYLLDKALRKT